MKTPRSMLLLPGLVIALAASPAAAHSLGAEGTGLLAGLAHPVTGLDHALALLALGLWGYQRHPRTPLQLPLLFAAMVVLGAALGAGASQLPGAETVIAVSVLTLGLLLLLPRRLPAALGATLVGVFALAHGHAHGAGMPGAAGALPYLLGLGVASAALPLAVSRLAQGLGTPLRSRSIRVVGATIASAGLLLWA